MATVMLSVPGISCEHCERTVTNALSAVPGVGSVRVDIPGKQVRVDYDETRTSVAQMESVLQEEEYPVASATPV
jgi:copper chaperone